MNPNYAIRYQGEEKCFAWFMSIRDAKDFLAYNRSRLEIVHVSTGTVLR